MLLTVRLRCLLRHTLAMPNHLTDFHAANLRLYIQERHRPSFQRLQIKANSH
jgi:hypothetical protein